MDQDEDTLILNTNPPLAEDDSSFERERTHFVGQQNAARPRQLSLSMNHSLGAYRGSLLPSLDTPGDTELPIEQLQALQLVKSSKSESESDAPGDNEKIARLRAERDRLRSLNDMLEKTIDNVSSVNDQFDRFKSITASTHHLMDVYTKLLNQQQHNASLLLNGEYEIDKDIAFLEQEERDQLEEQQRQRKEEEEKTLKQEVADRTPAAEVKRSASSAQASRGTTRGRSVSVASTVSSTSGIARGSGIPGRASAQVSGVRGVRGLRSRAAARGFAPAP